MLDRHYPVYPVCDAAGRLVGLVRGQALFEAQAIEISAAGRQHGRRREGGTPRDALVAQPEARHPWLQINLLTAFVAAAVVGLFQDTLDQLVILAVFLPVLAGQSGNTGCQALAVTLRGMTLGELKPGARAPRWSRRKRWLGCLNGVAASASPPGIGMFITRDRSSSPGAASCSASSCSSP